MATFNSEASLNETVPFKLSIPNYVALMMIVVPASIGEWLDYIEAHYSGQYDKTQATNFFNAHN